MKRRGSFYGHMLAVSQEFNLHIKAFKIVLGISMEGRWPFFVNLKTGDLEEDEFVEQPSQQQVPI